MFNVTVIIVIVAITIIGFLLDRLSEAQKTIEKKDREIQNEKTIYNNFQHHVYQSRENDQQRLKEEKKEYLDSFDPIAVEKAKYFGFLKSELSDRLDPVFDSSFYAICPDRLVDKEVKKDVFDEKFSNAFAIAFVFTLKAVLYETETAFMINKDSSREDYDTYNAAMRQTVYPHSVRIFCNNILNLSINRDTVSAIVNGSYNNIFTTENKTYKLDDECAIWYNTIVERCIKSIYIHWIQQTLCTSLETAAFHFFRHPEIFQEINDTISVARKGNAYLRNYAKIKSVVVQDFKSRKASV